MGTKSSKGKGKEDKNNNRAADNASVVRSNITDGDDLREELPHNLAVPLAQPPLQTHRSDQRAGDRVEPIPSSSTSHRKRSSSQERPQNAKIMKVEDDENRTMSEENATASVSVSAQQQSQEDNETATAGVHSSLEDQRNEAPPADNNEGERDEPENDHQQREQPDENAEQQQEQPDENAEQQREPNRPSSRLDQQQAQPEDNQQEPRPRPSLRETNSTRRLIIDQQNQAYEASLRADREKAEKREKERQEKLKKEEKRKEKAQFVLSMKEQARENLPEEPVRTLGGGDDGVFTLQFRVPPFNISFRRNFRNSDTLQSLHQFVLSHPETPFPFHIVRRPSQVIRMGNSDPDSTLQAAGFGVSEVLFVQAGEAPPPPVEDEKSDEITEQEELGDKAPPGGE